MMRTYQSRHLLSKTGIVLFAIFISVSAASAQSPSWFGDVFGHAQHKSDVRTARVVRLPHHIKAGQIIASFADQRLYYIFADGRAISYPIATPRSDSRWHGVMEISRKRINPAWTPTSEMRAQNPELPAFVPGGHPKNPLGSRALYLGSSLYRIHGTDAPSTIGLPVSKGCIRMHNRHVADLYNRVDVGTKVTITWNSYRRS